MQNAFNEFGQPIEAIENIASQLEHITREFFDDMVKQGYSATDIRATNEYLTESVNLAGTWAILDVKCRIDREKRKNADPNLDAEELEFIRNDKKIEAMKHYRQRSGLGLKESKDVVDKWVKDNSV